MHSFFPCFFSSILPSFIHFSLIYLFIKSFIHSFLLMPFLKYIGPEDKLGSFQNACSPTNVIKVVSVACRLQIAGITAYFQHNDLHIGNFERSSGRSSGKEQPLSLSLAPVGPPGRLQALINKPKSSYKRSNIILLKRKSLKVSDLFLWIEGPTKKGNTSQVPA